MSILKNWTAQALIFTIGYIHRIHASKSASMWKELSSIQMLNILKKLMSSGTIRICVKSLQRIWRPSQYIYRRRLTTWGIPIIKLRRARPSYLYSPYTWRKQTQQKQRNGLNIETGPWWQAAVIWQPGLGAYGNYLLLTRSVIVFSY